MIRFDTHMHKKIKMYRFKVSLVGYHHQPIKYLHRIIDISANAYFSALHDIIFEAFDRFDEHLYKFYLTRQQEKNPNNLFNCQEEVVLPDDIPKKGTNSHFVNAYTIGDADLQEKEFMYYWFDYGDDWIHRIRVEKIFYIENEHPDEEMYYYDIVKKVGESPPQYDDDSVWNQGNEQSLEQQMMVTLLALLDQDMAGQITLGDIEDLGILEMMVEADIIKQPDSTKGKSQLPILTEAAKAKGKVLMEMLENMSIGTDTDMLDTTNNGSKK